MPILNSFSVVEVRSLIEENSSWGSHFSAAPQICRVNFLTFGFAAKIPEMTVEFGIRTSRSGPTCSDAEIYFYLVWRRICRYLSRDSVILTRVGLSRTYRHLPTTVPYLDTSLLRYLPFAFTVCGEGEGKKLTTELISELNIYSFIFDRTNCIDRRLERHTFHQSVVVALCFSERFQTSAKGEKGRWQT